MQQMKRPGLSSLLIVVFALSAFVTCSAQTTSGTTVERSHANPAPQDSETLKALEIANIRLAAANEKIALLESQLNEAHKTTEAREGELAARREQVADLRSATSDRAAVNNGDARMLEACNQQVAKAEARIYSLEHPGLLRSIFDARTLSGFGAGYGARSLQEAFTRKP